MPDEIIQEPIEQPTTETPIEGAAPETAESTGPMGDAGGNESEQPTEG